MKAREFLEVFCLEGRAHHDCDHPDIVDAHEQADLRAVQQRLDRRRLDGQRAIERHVLGQGPVLADFERKWFFREDFLHPGRDDLVGDVERVKINHFAFHGTSTISARRPLSRKAMAHAGYCFSGISSFCAAAARSRLNFGLASSCWKIKSPKFSPTATSLA